MPMTELIPTEEIEQQCLFRWIDYAGKLHPELLLLIHIPNEGKRTQSAGARLKAVGLRKGVPDLFLPVARGKYHGLWIEMKRQKGGKTTKEQEQWLEVLQNEGYAAAVCRGWESAKTVLEKYLKIK